MPVRGEAEPVFHSGDYADTVVTELNILVEVRHQGLDLAQKLFALIVCLGVGVNLSLTRRYLLTARLECCRALVVGLLAGGILAESGGVGAYAV